MARPQGFRRPPATDRWPLTASRLQSASNSIFQDDKRISMHGNNCWRGKSAPLPSYQLPACEAERVRGIDRCFCEHAHCPMVPDAHLPLPACKPANCDARLTSETRPREHSRSSRIATHDPFTFATVNAAKCTLHRDHKMSQTMLPAYGCRLGAQLWRPAGRVLAPPAPLNSLRSFAESLSLTQVLMIYCQCGLRAGLQSMMHACNQIHIAF